MSQKLGRAFIWVAIALLAQPSPGQFALSPGDSALQFHPGAAQAFPNFAQTLTERSLMRHPEVLVVAFHAQIPNEQINRVIAINQAQWAKFLWRPSDEIDTDTAKTQRTVVQVIPATHRMEVHMPLHTRTGETIATFVCVWNFKDEEEAPDLFRKSQKIRDEIAPSIASVAQLLGKP
jgi:hypothetical protein